MLKVWNVSLIVATFTLALLGTFLVRSGILESIHAFGASTVGGPLLGLIAVVIVGSAVLIVSPARRPALGAADRVAGLARGGLPGQQPAPGRARRGDLLGHLLPPDLGGGHGRAVVAGLALVRPLHDAAGDRLVLFTGIGPLLAWRRVAPARSGGWSRAAAGGRGRDGRRWPRSPTRLEHPPALVLFAFAFFALAALAAEFWRGAAAQRALTGGGRLAALARDHPQPPPLRRLHRPRRDRDPVHRGRRLVELPDHARTCG